MRRLKPGDLLYRNRFVVATLKAGVLLNDATIQTNTKDVYIVSMGSRLFPVESAVYKILYENHCVAPKIEDIKEGDGLLIFNGLMVKFAIVAVIDRPNLFVYDTEGEIVPLNDLSVALSGWHDYEVDLLSARGKLLLRDMYP